MPAVADAIRTSLGPKGMDKMIQFGKGEVVITNDGATILKHMAVMHPAAKMLVDLSAAQDVEAGDGTTSVVVLAGSLLTAAESLLHQGIHPTIIAESFTRAAEISSHYLEEISTKLDLTDRESLLRAASTSLNSKIVSQYSTLLSPIAVDSVLKVIDPTVATNVDLRDIRLVTKLGGTIDDTVMVDGLVLTQNVITSGGGPNRMEKAKIALIQFQLSPPKPDIDNQVIVNDYRQMDKILKEERQYLLNLCKKIKKSGCNVLLIQKSILRDAVNDLSLHFLAKLKILAIKEIERDEVEFICKSTGCKPIADIESFTEDKLGYANMVEEVSSMGARYVQITGVKNAGKSVSVLIRGANQLVLEEAERSLHDALCVIRCLVKKRALIAGGGAPEVYISQKLQHLAKSLKGMEAYCFQEFANALEVIPYTLAENAGLNPIRIVTELRNRHANGEITAGINVRKGTISNILEENVIQPLLVSTSAITLASETVKMIMKIDDIYLFKFKIHDYHAKNVKKYGPILQTDGLAGNMVIVADAQEAKRILTDTDTFERGNELRSKMLGLLDNALFFLPSSDLWRKHRKLLQPAFGPTHLRHAAEASRESVLEFEQFLSDRCAADLNVQTDLHIALKCITLDIIMNSVQSLNGKSNGSWDDLDAISTDIFSLRFGTHPWLYKLLGVDLTSPKVAKAKQAIYKFLDELAEERLDKIRKKVVSQENWDMDVLHRLLISQDKGVMTKEEVYGELIGFFFAGHE
ncbi:T-complex protein 1 subunit delta [Terramyces sp. JEL0728]|nr:T-complex protein 1 subunit delta [Terramyces sp. JEL0728]